MLKELSTSSSCHLEESKDGELKNDAASSSSEKYEEARSKVAKFINANSIEEVIFTRGATEGINLVASCLSESYLKEGSEIILSTFESFFGSLASQSFMGARRILEPLAPPLLSVTL